MSTLAVVFSTGVTDGLVNYQLEKVAEALLGDRAASARDTCGIAASLSPPLSAPRPLGDRAALARDTCGIAASLSDSFLSARAAGATTDRVFAIPAALV